LEIIRATADQASIFNAFAPFVRTTIKWTNPTSATLLLVASYGQTAWEEDLIRALIVAGTGGTLSSAQVTTALGPLNSYFNNSFITGSNALTNLTNINVTSDDGYITKKLILTTKIGSVTLTINLENHPR
jgi:hypothetical protein